MSPPRVFTLELRSKKGEYGLSARRLYEHTEFGQINVFGNNISVRMEITDTPAFIDIVHFAGETFRLTGLTLADLEDGRIPANSEIRRDGAWVALRKAFNLSFYVCVVYGHLRQYANRKALRIQHHPFLPSSKMDDVFGIPFLYSTLQRRLQSMGKSKAGAEQWLKTVENLQKKGLRTEELESSNLTIRLSASHDKDHQFCASELGDLCDFSALRMSVIPVVTDAQQQLRFAGAPQQALTRTKKLPKEQAGQTRAITEFDPVLGYRIEQVEHQTLWGTESHWQAVLYQGQLIPNDKKQTLLPTKEEAVALAVTHARQNFPKRLALGRFSNCAWTGGKDYREWLITLPYYPTTYLSGHFKVRNVLAHVRCDVREGADGGRVLMLQEVQSDWAQRARKAISTGTMKSVDEVPPPFMKEWSALVMKLVLLHAAQQGLDAVTWTRGAHQVHRWNGLGAAGLIELYDRTLPRDVNRMMKPFGGACETLGVFVPTNFRIKQTENGYEVYSPENELLGIAPTLEDAREFVPDEGHELLYEVHGVRLSTEMRRAILSAGFPAWG